MVYLERFIFPDQESDTLIDDEARGSFYDDNTYPFHITSEMGLWALDLEPITILYGGNGSGKSTIINVISQKLKARRQSMFNSGPYFDEYVSRCQYRADDRYDLSEITTVLTSDDIFRWMLDLRQENDRKLRKSYILMDEYRTSDEPRLRHLNLETGYNVDKFKRSVEMMKVKNGFRNRNHTFNKFLLKTVGKMERGFSNGETALMKLSEFLEAPGLYLLDEPENSMSCEFQIKLSAIISYLAVHGRCQFLISSHSPFILSMENARIYNLDRNPVDVCRWWELDNMKYYFDLFNGSRDLFLR